MSFAKISIELISNVYSTIFILNELFSALHSIAFSSLARYIASPIRLSVRLSNEVRIITFLLYAYGSPIPLVFARASNKGGVRKTSHFLALNVNITKTVRYTAKVTINH